MQNQLVTRSATCLLVAIALLLGALGCHSDLPQPPAGKSVATLKVMSSSFRSGTAIPPQFTADDHNQSPPIEWSSVPADTKSLALVCDDPDASDQTWVHWVVFNIPPEMRKLEFGIPADETLPNGAIHGQNDFGDLGYGGPAPPKGQTHRYYFKLYALDTMLDLPPRATKAQLLAAMEGHLLGAGELIGTYRR
jgi:Raf kinase inhibitor-like YbhB/YbcL family protein